MKKMLMMICILLLQSIDIYSIGDTTCLRFSDISGNDYLRPSMLYSLESTHFLVHYNTVTDSLYAEDVKRYAEEAYSKICTERNWQSPPADEGRGGDDRYDIYVGQNADMGVTIAEYNANAPEEWSMSYIEIRNNLFTGDDLKVTLVHEFCHAVQFSYTYRDGYVGPNSITPNFWFYENCATYLSQNVYGIAELNYFDNYWGVDPLHNPELGITSQGPGTDLYVYAAWI